MEESEKPPATTLASLAMSTQLILVAKQEKK